ncbi:hypothetical protein RHSIM_Rhsim11G0061300 [Rhododendron simsii]|uniref:Retrotransposon gag domain-containing protein n=1 Tax=Rhododendron simsii TaxID=118357 RepID=A0A834G8W6_RHOSS|nr:hypothetical protein RHSIM_Rhsim11G0061300 [Rhododendron simsii]
MASEHTVHAEDARSGDHDQVEESEVPSQQPVVGDADKLLAAVALLAEQQAALMQRQTTEAMTRGTGTGLLERFKKLFTVEFEGAIDPSDAEEWLKSVERVLKAMGVTDAQKVTLATFSLKGNARNWWESFERQWTAPLPGIISAVPRVVTWERFVKGFNDHYFPKSWKLDQEAAFIELKQDSMTVPEYEARFAKLSKHAPNLVNTEEKRCQQFRKGLSSKVATRLTTYEQEEYARLVEMARRVGKDIQDYNDNRESYKKSKTEGAAFGKFGGGTSKGGGQKSQVTRIQDFGKSQGGLSGCWKGKAEQGPNRQTVLYLW